MEPGDETFKLPDDIPSIKAGMAAYDKLFPKEETVRQFFDRKWVHEPTAKYKACVEAGTHYIPTSRWDSGCVCHLHFYNKEEFAFYKKHKNEYNQYKEEYYKDVQAYCKAAEERLNGPSSKQENTQADTE